MRKRIFTLALAIVMILQTMMPVAGLAKGLAPKQKNMVKVGDIDTKSYPQPSLKAIQEANRRKKLQLQGGKIPGGAQLFSAPYFPNQDPTDDQKPLIFANVNAIFATKGLDGGKFDWEGVFGKDADGKQNKAQIVFEQLDDKTSTRTGVKFFLKVDKDGTYTWSDSEGKPTKLPLYSTDLKPYRYEVLLDEDVSEHVKLLTARFFGTSGGYAFGKPDPVTGEIVGNINLDLTLQQIASTKFTSKWNTGVEESNRPTVEGSFLPGNETDPENYGFFKFPSNDTDKTIIRNDALDPQNPAEYSEYLARDLEKTPTVGVADPDPEATDTYTIDRDNKRISYKEKTYKYEVEYDVINGGKLTMTEILPVTFDANGGKFASVTEPNAEQKIKSEVDYEKDATVPEAPTKEGETFIGWGDKTDATTPVSADAFKGIKEAKTFYAIFTKDIIKQEGEDKPKDVPAGHVKVTVDVTDKAKLGQGEKKTRIFWVDPKKEVTLPVAKPTGKDVPVNDTNPKAYTWEFSKWTSDEKPSRTWSEGIETGITAIFPKGTTITANYDKNITDQGTVVAKEITVHESLKKSETEWVNNFIPKEEDLKKLVQVKDSDGNVKDLTQDDKVEFILGDKTQTEKYTSLDEELYDKLKEKDNPNGEPTRVETIKAKVTFKNGEVQTVAIPMKVYKNIYKADTKGDKPSYVPDGYVKVTLDPTKKAQDSQKTYYYVNPAAKVIIPGSDPTGTSDNVFSKWTVKADDADQDDQAKDYALKDRHKFEKASTITAQYVSNVVEQEDPEKKPSVPKDYIKVIVDTTDKATAGTKFEKTFWVNPNKEVTIPVTNPTGNKPDGKDYTWTFKTWQLAETNGTDFGTTIKGTFAKESRIEAKYEVKQETLTTAIKIAKDKLVPQDGPLDPRDLVTNLYKDGDPDNKGNLPPGSKVTFVDKPDLSKAGDTKVKIKVDIPGGKTTEIEVPIKVVDKVVKQEGKDKPKVPESYIQIRIVPTDKATDETKADTIYWVKPKDEVTLPITNPTGRDDNHFAKWKMKADDEGADGIKDFDATQATSFEKATTITAQYVSNVIPANEDGSKPDTVPANYVEVKFVPTDKATDQTEKIYWVNPDKEVAIPVANPIGKQYFTFKEWKMGADAKGAVYTPSTAQKFTKAITVITATYDEAKNIIPYDPSVSDPMVRPDGYVRVTFEVETGLKLTEQKAYYVKKNAGIKLGNTDLAKPAYKAETGYKFDKWDPADTTTIADKDIVVKAKATKLPTVIPEKDANGNDNKKPEGYKEVTFVVKSGDESKGSIESNAKFYVNPTEYVKITPPATTANTGYEFGAWSQNTENFTNYKENTTITGSFNELDAVIPKTNPNGTENKKPAGYKTVTFVIDPATGGKIADGEVTVYYVNPAKEVTVPQPKTNADTGYEFVAWDQDTVSMAKKYDKDTTVKGNFKKLDDIIPSTDANGNPNAKPVGYVTVTFYKGASGKSITGQTVYYVNPKAGVTLSDITYPSVEAMEGAIFRGWYPADKNHVIKQDLAVIALFDVEKPYPVPVPTPGGGNGSDQPNKPDQPNQSKVGKGALNDTDHYQYLIGYPDGNFGPNRGMTRAEAATMFTRLLRQRPVKGNRYNAGLSDIHAGDWYANTVGYAVQRGIVSGYPDGSFKPNKPITRAEFAAIASRFDELAQGNDIAFNDLAPSHWGYNAIRSAATKGWISGYPDNTFRPEQAITRAEVTAITNRMLNRYADLYWIDAHRSEVIRFGDVKRSDWYFEPIMEATMGHDFIRDRDMKTEHWTGLNGKSFIEAR